MESIKAKQLTDHGFKTYGSYTDMLNPQTPALGEVPVRFFRDMDFFSLGCNNNIAFSVTQVLRRPFIIDAIEFHSKTGEAIIPLDGDVIIHVGLATLGNNPPYDALEAFRVPEGTLVSMRPGVWHGAPFAVDCDQVNVLVVLPERTYANDCYFMEIPENNRIMIE